MSSSFVQRGGGWVLGQSVLLSGVILGGVFCPGTWENARLVVLGRLLLVISVACGVAGVMAIGRNLTPYPKPSASARLVRTGIYGLMRHPLYTAVFCGAAGWALLRESGPALVLAVMLGAFFDRKARREERWLRQRFPEYAAYAQRVRRFIPGLY